MTAVAMTDALPLTEADGSTGRNNGRDFRKGLLASLLVPDVKTDPLAVRNGVLPHDYDTNGVTSLRVEAQATPDNTALVRPGPFVCERAGQGPYIGWTETALTVTPPNADVSNPRIDVVYAHVRDIASIATDPGTGPVLDVLQGTPAASPTAPTALPDGAVALAQVLRPANNSTITAARITDVRRSSGLWGAVRVLLAGDAVSDPGKVRGELRFRAAAGSLPALVDYWDGTQWRGTMSFVVTDTFPGTPDSASLVYGTVGNSTSIVTTTIPDPGFPYRLTGAAHLRGMTFTNNINGSFYINVNNGPFASAIVVAGPGPENIYLMPVGGTVYTGSVTARLKVDPIGPGNGQITWRGDVRNKITYTIIPA
ncbi:hypothetical protein [Amycolatopsis taiwanensis]|uniref:hypothetical protein n=1 Tax=Amycolatopsis taiwanensis TaxID=342230 RepID=UPI00048254E4|nr:hypothetical protein [Amycolatopsis taiwanensis]